MRFVISLMLLFVFACFYGNAQNQLLTVLSETGSYSFSSKGSVIILNIYADKNAEWQLTTEQDWIIIKKYKEKGSQKIKIKSLENKTGKIDEGGITVTCGNEKKNVTFKRYAKLQNKMVLSHGNWRT